MSAATMLMEPPSAAAARALADDLHAFLAEIDLAARRARAAVEAHEGLAGLREQAAALVAHWEAQPAPDASTAEAALKSAVESVWHALPEPSRIGEARGEWDAVQHQLTPAYNALAQALSELGEPVGKSKPSALARSAAHVGLGLVVVLAFELLLSRTGAILGSGAFVAFAWSLEGARRASPAVNRLCMAFFRSIARPHEHYRINSSTWFGTGLFLLALTTPDRAAMLGVLALSFADPVAAFVGRRWGRRPLVGRKTLEGTAAFAVTAFGVSVVYMGLCHGDISGATLLFLAAVTAVTGALTELLVSRIDDNLAIPVVTGWVVALVGLAL